MTLILVTVVLWERILSSKVGVLISDSLFRPGVSDWLFAFKHPGWWAHIKCFLSFLGVAFALTTGTVLGIEGKEGRDQWASDFLPQLLKERTGLIPKRKIGLLFRNVPPPSHTTHFLSRSKDSFFKRMRQQSLQSQVCLSMKTYSCEKWKTNIWNLLCSLF